MLFEIVKIGLMHLVSSENRQNCRSGLTGRLLLRQYSKLRQDKVAKLLVFPRVFPQFFACRNIAFEVENTALVWEGVVVDDDGRHHWPKFATAVEFESQYGRFAGHNEVLRRLQDGTVTNGFGAVDKVRRIACIGYPD